MGKAIEVTVIARRKTLLRLLSGFRPRIRPQGSYLDPTVYILVDFFTKLLAMRKNVRDGHPKWGVSESHRIK